MSAATCSTCAHWHRAAPPLATAIRHANPDQWVGTCQLLAPSLISQAGVPMTLFPQTHADRTCGDWMISGPHGPDDGEEIDSNVVPLRGAAA